MSFEAGTTIGPYEVTGSLGAGGMGEVYRAHDSKLDRDVALKVLPDAFTSDPDRLARFEREAKVLASLNHPNIAAIHGLEDLGRQHALVLELVEGLTLADLAAQGPMPVKDAVQGPYAIPFNTGRHYDVSPDGSRFLLLRDAGGPGMEAALPQMTIVRNWFEELEALVPTN